MNKYLIILLVIIGLLGSNTYLYNTLQKTRESRDKNYNNYLTSSDENKALKLTLNEVKYSNDSIVGKLDSVLQALKVKNKDILQMSYIKEKIYITDTLNIKDTIFIENFKLDTIIGSSQTKVKLNLEYPNHIDYTFDISNEKYITHKIKKEYLKPKKCFPLYWFQKKINTIEVLIEDSNKDLKIQQTKHIIIVDN